ncbi:MAG: hypothetical protein KUG78_00040 [Kangiellaceae bacterium]|nr:hypothetical protein [Kangiellaceae bacterium]
MKLINNYLNSFESYLPEESRKEIREELESSLLDQLEDQQEQLGRELNTDEQEKLLLKIGHPMKVAAAYLPNQQLINADYFPAYKRALQFALWVFGAITILRLLPFNVSIVDGSFFTTPIVIFWSLAETGIWVFAWVTLIFFLMQKYQANLDILYAWSPKNLSNTVKKTPLSRVEVVFEMIFVVLFLYWWNSLFTAESIFIQFLINSIGMSQEMLPMQWPVNILGGLGLAVSLYNLICAGWNKTSLVFNIIVGIADLIIISIMMQFDQYVIIDLADSADKLTRIFEYTDLNIRITLAVIAGFVIWDLISSYRKL